MLDDIIKKIRKKKKFECTKEILFNRLLLLLINYWLIHLLFLLLLLLSKLLILLLLLLLLLQLLGYYYFQSFSQFVDNPFECNDWLLIVVSMLLLYIVWIVFELGWSNGNIYRFVFVCLTLMQYLTFNYRFNKKRRK